MRLSVLVAAAALVASASHASALDFSDIPLRDVLLIQQSAEELSGAGCAVILAGVLDAYVKLNAAGLEPQGNDTTNVILAIESGNPDVRIAGLAFATASVLAAREKCVD